LGFHSPIRSDLHPMAVSRHIRPDRTPADERRAREIAERKLEESPHHLAIEVAERDVTLFRLERRT
jgi:hypothetical protein